MPTKTKDRWDYFELAKILGVEKFFEAADEWNADGAYNAGWKSAEEEGLSEEECEERAMKYERAELDEGCNKLWDGFDRVLKRVHEICGLRFVKMKKGMYRPESNNWANTADSIRNIINGVGMFHFKSLAEFIEVGPYSSARQAALHHLHWISSYPEVYGDRSFSRIIEDYLR